MFHLQYYMKIITSLFRVEIYNNNLLLAIFPVIIYLTAI